MSSAVPVLVPWAEHLGTKVDDPAPRVSSLERGLVGIVDNGWHCMRIITEVLTDALQEQFGAAGVVVKHTSGSLTMTTADRADLQRRCSAVIVGIGACGSCTRWVLKDAVELERSGTPTVSLYTEAFDILAVTLARTEGMADLPKVLLPHPLNSLPDDEIRLAAHASIDRVARALLVATVPA
jgi:hypothetical protein